MKSYLSLIMARYLTATSVSESISSMSLASTSHNINGNSSLQPFQKTYKVGANSCDKRETHNIKGCSVMTSEQALRCARTLLCAVTSFVKMTTLQLTVKNTQVFSMRRYIVLHCWDRIMTPTSSFRSTQARRLRIG